MTRRPILELAAPVLVLWALLAPWMWGFDDSAEAVANHIAFAIAFVPLALLAGPLTPAAVVVCAGGAWLAASPWVLGYAAFGVAAWAVDLIAGVGLMAAGMALVGRGRTSKLAG
jgi:hypothetical protein